MAKPAPTPETLARQARIKELEAIIAREEYLTPDEYKGLLREILKNSTASLAIKTVQAANGGTGALINIIEKVHYLLDSVEGKEAPPEDHEIVLRVEYDLPLPEKDA